MPGGFFGVVDLAAVKQEAGSPIETEEYDLSLLKKPGKEVIL